MSRLCFWGDVHPGQMPDPASIRRWTAGAPLFCNLEAVLSDRSPVGVRSVHLLAPPGAAATLRAAGTAAVHVANNHMLDAGDPGWQDTLRALQQQGIAAVGRLDSTGRVPAAHLDLDGRRVTLLGYGENCQQPLAPMEPERMIGDVRRERPGCDRLVVSLHWGIEYVTLPSPAQQKLARRLVDAGADLVIGHHPHVASGVERHGSGWIAYSLGNACLWADELRLYPSARIGLQLDYDLESGAISLRRLRLGDRPGELAVDVQTTARAADDHPALNVGWRHYLAEAGPVYLRSQAAGWRRRFRSYGISQWRPLLRWFASRMFLQMAGGALLSLWSRTRPHQTTRKGHRG